MDESTPSKPQNDYKVEVLERIHETRLFAIEQASRMRNQAIGVLGFAALILGIAAYLFIDKTIEDRLGDIAEERYLKRAEAAAAQAEAAAVQAQEFSQAIEDNKASYASELPKLAEVRRAALRRHQNTTSAASINPHRGFWGNWTKVAFCPAEHYVCGLKVRMEPDLGTDRDDTALNSVELQCCRF